MKILEKYTGERTYMFPNGSIATRAAVLEHFPACLDFVHVVETDENHEMMWALQNLSAMRSMYKIDASLTEEEAIAAIQEIINTDPPAPVDTGENTAEERIAAALETQVMLSMETVNPDDPDID